MRRFVIVFLFFSHFATAQAVDDDFLEKRVVSVSVDYQVPIGNYASKLKNPYAGSSALGLKLDYFFNPQFKKDVLSQVFVGLEMGLNSASQKDFLDPSQKYDFYANYQSLYFLPGVRFYPFLTPKKILFYFQGSAGPMLLQNKIVENLGDGNTQNYFAESFSSIIGKGTVGMDIRLKKKGRNYRYFGINASVESGRSLKFWNRNKLGFDSFDNVNSQILVSNPSSIHINVSYSFIR